MLGAGRCPRGVQGLAYNQTMPTPAGMLALRMLQGDQTLLDVAREVTAAIKASGAEGGVVGGIAVFLHGYERTTTDIDVYTHDRPALAEKLVEIGFVWSDDRRQFERDEVPVQLLAPNDDLPYYPEAYSELQGIRVVRLADLINMKLSVGQKFEHHAQDIADVYELIANVPLDKTFAPKVAQPYRDAFKRMVDVVQQG